MQGVKTAGLEGHAEGDRCVIILLTSVGSGTCDGPPRVLLSPSSPCDGGGRRVSTAPDIVLCRYQNYRAPQKGYAGRGQGCTCQRLHSRNGITHAARAGRRNPATEGARYQLVPGIVYVWTRLSGSRPALQVRYVLHAQTGPNLTSRRSSTKSYKAAR